MITEQEKVDLYERSRGRLESFISSSLSDMGIASIDPPPGGLFGGEKRKAWVDKNFRGGYSRWWSLRYDSGIGGSRGHNEWQLVVKHIDPGSPLFNYVNPLVGPDFRIGEFWFGAEAREYNAFTYFLSKANARLNALQYPGWIAYEKVVGTTPTFPMRPNYWTKEFEEEYRPPRTFLRDLQSPPPPISDLVLLFPEIKEPGPEPDPQPGDEPGKEEEQPSGRIAQLEDKLSELDDEVAELIKAAYSVYRVAEKYFKGKQ